MIDDHKYDLDQSGQHMFGKFAKISQAVPTIFIQNHVKSVKAYSKQNKTGVDNKIVLDETLI
jgi:hypothetical protein